MSLAFCSPPQEASCLSPKSPFILLVMLGGALASICSPNVFAQEVTFTGTQSAVNFGSVNACKSGKTTAAPCSKTLTLTYKITASGAFDTPRVLTAGSSGLDFTLAAGSTCEGSLVEGNTCEVKVTFTPKLAGGRPGAVEIRDEGGAIIATTYIYGSGAGPRIATLTQGLSMNLPFVFTQDSAEFQFAVDGAGDIFGAGGPLYELPADGGAQVIKVAEGVGGGFPTGGLMIDGAGNFFNANGSDVVEVPANGAPFGFTGLNDVILIGVDGAGDVFIVDSVGPKILRLPAGCHSKSCSTVVAQFHQIYGMAVDVAGDLFVAYQENPGQQEVLAKMPAGGGSPIILLTGINIYALTTDGVGNIIFFGDQATQELLSGTTTPITLQGDITEDDYSYSFGTDLVGDLFEYTSMDDEEPSTDYASVTRQAQFAPLNFGTLARGQSKTLPLAITNTGNRTLTFTPSFVSPTYHILSSTPENCEEAVAPSHTCTLNVEFSPLTTGPHTIQLTLKANTTDAVILLEGVGTK